MKFSLTLLLFVNYQLFSQTWTRLEDFPGGKRDDATAFTVGDRAFLTTGRGVDFSYLRDLWMFDPTSGTWEKQPDLPGTPRQYAASFVIADTGYVVCGLVNDQGDCLQELWGYCPQTGQWDRKSDLPGKARQSPVAFAYGDKGFVMTGRNKSEYLRDSWQYNAKKNTWVQLQDFPGEARFEAVSLTFSGGTLVGLGKSANSFLEDCWFFDPVKLTWEKKQDFPFGGLYYTISGVIGNSGYVSTGQDAAGNYRSGTYEYDPAQDQWQQSSALPGRQRRGCAAFVLKESLYVATGLLSTPARTDEVWQMKIPPPPIPRFFVISRNHQVTVQGTVPINSFILYSMDGKKTLEASPGSQTLFIDTRSYQEGIYIYHINEMQGGVVVIIH